MSLAIHHDGIAGISKVHVSIELSDFSSNRTFWEYLEEDFMLIEQVFEYKHFWVKDNISRIVKQSGHPGYQGGKPILSGMLKKVDKGSTAGNMHSTATSSKGEDLWVIDRRISDRYLTLMAPTLSGNCNDGLPNER